MLPKQMNPVQFLYHGTCYKYSHQIDTEGLQPVNHDKVYLTADIVVAYEYAKTASSNNDLSLPVICIVDAVQMHKDGYKFTHEATNAEWTTEYVLPKYLLQIIPESLDELEQLLHYAQEKVTNENC